MEIQAPVQIERNAVGPLTLRLTERESEVSALIARGLTNPEIAANLGISATTVRTHIDNIFIKLGVHRRVQIAQLYWLNHSTEVRE